MNNAKIWLVVKPTVGIPLFLGAVASTSLFVHWNVLNNTTYLSNYAHGKPKKAASLEAPVAGSDKTAVVVFKDAADPSAVSQEAVVVLPDGRTGRVVFAAPDAGTTLASAALDLTK